MADKTATDTSTNEDVKDDLDLEDFGDEGFESGVEVPDKDKNGKPLPASKDDTEEVEQESEADETETTEGDEAKEDDSQTEKPDEEITEEESTEEDSKDETTKEKDTLSEDERKRHNDEMAKARIAERDAKAAADKARKDADEATIERYLREAGDDEMELEKRKLNVEAYRVQQERIDVNESRLQAGIEKAVANIELFRSGSKAIQEELAASLDDFERMYVRKDDKGRPIEVIGDVYQYLQSKADSIKKLQADGATRQEKSKSKQQSRTITPPVKAPKKKKVDADVEAFDQEAARY